MGVQKSRFIRTAAIVIAILFAISVSEALPAMSAAYTEPAAETENQTEKFFCVSYNSNGGTGSYTDILYPEGFPAPVLSDSDTAIVPPARRYFLCWSTEADGSGISYFPGEETAPLSKDLTLYAQWAYLSKIKCEVIYHGNGGGNPPTDAASPYYQDSIVTVLGTEAMEAPPGKAFTGWVTNRGKPFQPGDRFLITGKVDMYAQWEYSYSISYDLNGGSGWLIDLFSPYFSGNMAALLYPDTIIPPAGFKFDGWNTEPDGTGTAYEPGQRLAMRSDMLLYAQWSPIHIQPELEMGEHFAYLIGYPDGSIQPHSDISRGEAATIFFRLLTEDSRKNYFTDENSFSDVRPYLWFNEAVSTMANAAIIKGYPEGFFAPGSSITRAEFAAMAVRFSKIAPFMEHSFEDIDRHWAANDIKKAASLGWIEGKDGKFRPDDYITRAEAVTLVNRMLGRGQISAHELPEDMLSFKDNRDSSAWFYSAIQEAANSHKYEKLEDGSEQWLESESN